MTQAEIILMVLKVWGWIGAAVALAFLTFGMDKIDEDADGAYVFRPLVVPGILLVWPLVLWRWAVLATGKDHWPNRYRTKRRNHHWVGMIMPVAIIIILTVGWSVRQAWPDYIMPEQLSPPVEVTQ